MSEDGLVDAIAGEPKPDPFTRYSPLVTLLFFMIGPSATLLQAIGGSIEVVEITSYFTGDDGEYAMAVIGFTTTMVMCSEFIGAFFGQAIMARVSRLIGEGKRELAHQVIADIVRFGFLFSVVFASLFHLAVKPYLKFVSCSDDAIMTSAYHYCVCLIGGVPIITLFSIGFSLMQGVGKPLWNFLVRLIVQVLQVGAITPIFLWGFGVKVDYIKISQLIAQMVTTVGVVIVLWKVKTDMLVPFRYFVQKPVLESLKSVGLMLPTVVQFLCYSLPPMLVLSVMTDVEPDMSTEIAAAMGVWNTVSTICITLIATFALGFLTPATHSYGQKNYSRFMMMFRWGMLFCLLPFVVIWPVTVFKPELMVGAFLSEGRIDYAAQIVRIPFVTFPIQGIIGMGVMSLIAVGKPIVPIIVSSIQCILLCAGSKVIGSKMADGEAYKVMYIYNVADAVSGTFYGIGMLVYFVPLCRKMRSDYVEVEDDTRRSVIDTTIKVDA